LGGTKKWRKPSHSRRREKSSEEECGEIWEEWEGQEKSALRGRDLKRGRSVITENSSSLGEKKFSEPALPLRGKEKVYCLGGDQF